MIEYWLQNGKEVLHSLRMEAPTLNEDLIKRLLEPIFQNDGKHTRFSSSMFSQMLSKNLDDLCSKIVKSLKKIEGERTCSFCGAEQASKLKGMTYPFVISKDKFPNLYPHGRVESLNICRSCAIESIAAYHNIIFNAQDQDYCSAILFFSTDPISLNLILHNYFQVNPVVKNYFRNWDFGNEIIYYPYEFLAKTLYDLSTNLTKMYEISNIEFGAFVLGFVPTKKKIYSYVGVARGLSPIITIFYNFRLRLNRIRNAFDQLFGSMRKARTGRKQVSPDEFLARDRFFRQLLVQKSIDWLALEEILFYNIDKEPPKSIAFINPFLQIALSELDLPEKELYDKVSGLGYHLGKALLELEDAKRCKSYVYELRRTRKLHEFLDIINRFQLSVEKGIDDRPLRENESLFPMLKVIYMIGMCNAIFSGKGEEDK
ncbi:MAG: hypothetical protein ACPLY9_04205 [Nitrososphaerales archaeon]